MSDLSDLHGVYPTPLRWNAETGVLAISVFNAETGERELQEIDLGKQATFAMDLATRARGYGLVRTGTYDMRLTPVGSPPPPWPGDEEFKPALGCWLWNPTFGELRIETNAAIFQRAITSVWDGCRLEPEAAEGLQPVICFVDRAPVKVKQVNKTFLKPMIQVVGWLERNQVPGWAAREPTVAAPKAMPVLPAAAAPAAPAASAAPTTSATPAAAKPIKRSARIRPSPEPDPNDPIDDVLGDDSIPFA